MKDFTVGQRVHFIGQPRRIGTVKDVGFVERYSSNGVRVDWDADGEGKHDGSHNDVKYFIARGSDTTSLVRPQNLSGGVSLLEAWESRYRAHNTKEEEDEIYVLSARNKKVSIELLGKGKIEDKMSRFEDCSDERLEVFDQKKGCGDLQYAKASVPLSPQWLFPKPRENKAYAITGENYFSRLPDSDVGRRGGWCESSTEARKLAKDMKPGSILSG